MKKLKKPVKKFLAPLVKAYAAGGESNSNPCTITQNGCPCTPGNNVAVTKFSSKLLLF